MGFCRRCGEIVHVQSTRCKCGGSAVAPTVKWNHSPQKGSPDRWADTYVSNSVEAQRTPEPIASLTPIKTGQTVQAVQSPTRKASSPEKTTQGSQSFTKLTRRFPRPISTSAANPFIVDSKASQHIASATAQRPSSPLKRHSTLSLESPSDSAPDVITSPDNATLAKAYGSVLQRPETLPIHTCASCSAVFPPDATIYPNPHSPSGTRFLCRPCFATQGGSKGDCASCGREVLTIAREGDFIESAGKVWHKRCFRCESCFKDIGHAPMVDLLGKPSCAECFDTCLERRGSPRSRKKSEFANNIGGLRGRSRESSPALEELSERLGIKRSSTPESPRDSRCDISVSPSPARVRPGSRDDKTRHDSASLRVGDGTPPLREKVTGVARKFPPPLRAMTTGPVAAIEPTTPDLSSAASSDTLSTSAPSTPSNSPRQSLTPNSRESITPKAKGMPTRLNIVTTGEAKCTRCSLPLFNTTGRGRIVTVPAESATGVPASYHASCFRCFVCGDTFDGGETAGQAMFVKDSRGISHPGCSETRISKSRSPSPFIASNPSPERDPPFTAPPISKSFPRFGGSEACPGCRRSVSLMEYGVVPGPQNSRWHVSCLVCGGKGAKPPRPGCGKKLDSAAKTDREGGVWCRECMLLLPVGACPSSQGSPTRGGLTPSYTGTAFDRFSRPEAGRLFGQVTGNAYEQSEILARQFTGGGPSPVRRGSVSPTRQMRSVSPTKGLMPVTRHPRPALGTWRHRSVDEGRGMFLVKQMTGNGQFGL